VTDGRRGGVWVGRVLQLGAGRREAAGATNGVALGVLPAFAALLTFVRVSTNPVDADPRPQCWYIGRNAR
jgi:hypothetical protein